VAIVSSCLISRGLSGKTGDIHFSLLSAAKIIRGRHFSYRWQYRKNKPCKFVCAQKGVSWSDPHFLVVFSCGPRLSSDRRCPNTSSITNIHHPYPRGTRRGGGVVVPEIGGHASTGDSKLSRFTAYGCPEWEFEKPSLTRRLASPMHI
jgi:hypothetical protein